MYSLPGIVTSCGDVYKGCLDTVDWNGGMEWNDNKLDTSHWFSPLYKATSEQRFLVLTFQNFNTKWPTFSKLHQQTAVSKSYNETKL